MKRILHVVNLSENIGGIEQIIMNIYDNVDKNKVKFDFLSSSDKTLFKDKIFKYGGHIYTYPSEFKHPIKCIIYLKNIISKNKYDYIHIHKNSLANSLIIYYFKFIGCKNVILHSHNTNSTGNYKIIKTILHFLNKPFVNYLIDFKFSCSDLASRWMFGKNDLNNIFYVNNAIDVSKFSFNQNYREEIRNKFGIKENDFVIGHVGRFTKEKNHIFIINILKNILQDNTNCKLMLIGEGKLKHEIESLVNSLNLKNNVLFVGTTKEVYKYYNAFDCFILPSLHEGLPLVGIEAQLNCLKCFFSSNITREIVLSKNSYLIDIDDPIRWGENIKQVTSFQRNKFVLPENSVKAYDIQTIAKKVENFYMENTTYEKIFN